MARWASLVVSALAAVLLFGPVQLAAAEDVDPSVSGDPSPSSLAPAEPEEAEPESDVVQVPNDSGGNLVGDAVSGDLAAVSAAPFDWSWYLVGSIELPMQRTVPGSYSALLEGPATPVAVNLRVSVQLPSMLAFVQADEVAVSCAAAAIAGVYDCPFTPSPYGTRMVFGVSPAPGLAIGTQVGLTVTVEPTEAVGDVVENNSFNHIFEFVGTADLTYQVLPATPAVAVGQSVDVQFVINNQGPDAATNVIGRIALQANPSSALILTAVGSGSEIQYTEDGRAWGAFWNAGDIPAGESRSLTFTVFAAHPSEDGQASISVYANGDQPNPADNISDLYGAVVSIVPAAPTSTTSTTTASTTSTSTTPPTPTSPTAAAPPKVKGPTLAATGQAVGGLAIYGGVSVLVGVAFLLSARRRKA